MRASIVIDELQRLPVGFMEQIIEYRHYREAHAANKANVPGWEASALRTLAMEIELELAEEELTTHA